MRRREALFDPYRRFRVLGRAMEPYRRRRFAAFGKGSIVHRAAWIYRPDLMQVGSGVWIGPRAWFEVSPPAFAKGTPAIRIGDGVVMRHHVTISAADAIDIEDDVLIAAWTSIYDSDHTVGPSGNPIWYPHRTAPVRVGQGSWIGERVAVLRGADIGRHCIIGANSVVKGVIPDFSIAVGAPARVVGTTREMVAGARLSMP